MSTIRIDGDEWYPVYFVSSNAYGHVVNVDAATVERWARVFAEFEAVQDEMKAAIDAALKANP